MMHLRSKGICRSSNAETNVSFCLSCSVFRESVSSRLYDKRIAADVAVWKIRTLSDRHESRAGL
jgi:hypothetical protein